MEPIKEVIPTPVPEVKPTPAPEVKPSPVVAEKIITKDELNNKSQAKDADIPKEV